MHSWELKPFRNQKSAFTNWYACGTTYWWPLFESQHQRKDFPWDFIWSSINISYFHFKMQILVYFQTEMKLLKILKESPFSKGIHGMHGMHGMIHSMQKCPKLCREKWYRQKLFSLVYEGHNQKIFCRKRYYREKVSCIKKNPCTTAGFSCYPLSFYLYSNLNKSEEQTWTEKLILRSIDSSRIKMIDVPCTEGHLRVKAWMSSGYSSKSCNESSNIKSFCCS